MEATMHQAKTNLSKLVARARAGEEVILTHGKSRAPLARIVAIEPVEVHEMKERPIGYFAKEMGTEFFEIEPMTAEELALWEAPIVSTWTSNSPVSDDSE
jgi:prevent-host-death family protein